MTTPTNLKIDALNFENIKDNLKLFLQSQDQFRDYNFEASGISTLLDILAYNTYYNSFYLNVVSSESVLATAQKRNSVVNLARSLGYTPRSTTSAKIVGSITLAVNGTPASVTMPAYSRFGAVVDGATYFFLNREPLTFTRNNAGNYILENVELTEGEFVSERYVVNNLDADQRFLINNENVDTSTLLVRVLNSTTDSTVRVFERSTNFVELNGESTVYFLEEVEDGKFEVFFGDNVIGKALDNDNLVYFDYIVSNGQLANNIRLLTFNSATSQIVDATFVAEDVSFGGEERESIERIRFNAPKAYTTQNRAITTEDYASILLNESNIGSVAVWGGEDNEPPAYGKVFIAVRPKVGEALTTTEKDALINTVIKPKKILTVQTEIVDPEYIYLLLTANVKYDPNQTISSEASVQQKILETIKRYADEDIGQFSKYFRYSKLSRLIDTCERSILSSVLTIFLRKELDIQLGTSSNYVINFSNPISAITRGRTANHPYGVGSQISSNAFTLNGLQNCFLEDNSGIIRIYRRVGSQNIGVSQNAGTINYETGQIILENFAPSAFLEGGVTLKITATPQNLDILPLRGQIVDIRDEDISITLTDDSSISLVRR